MFNYKVSHNAAGVVSYVHVWLKKHMKVSIDARSIAKHFIIKYVLNIAMKHECKNATMGVCLVNNSFKSDINQVAELLVASNILIFTPLSF